ncbi:Aste57867_14050 [Aphanomyces stellatus]|uniref:Aste57867_14050 protein n=1 Tax=Aphanomyces stellatus TaxID=120398 RepID=A0A485L012_9STRA|nr:hypothetical protein As57867_013999 [Aphanomyces stellatus]VFT90879.1 Aste57867_14050 [Aphanomyces stellatus]
MLPFPLPFRRVVRASVHALFLALTKQYRARLFSRKRAKLLQALDENVAVAYGTCALVHINGETPQNTFVRIQTPHEQYFAIGTEFEETAQLVQRTFDKPRDGKKFLMSLERLPYHALGTQTRRLVADATRQMPDWITPPAWIPADFGWTDPLKMSSTKMLRLCHLALEQIFEPNFCGRVHFFEGRIIFQD